MSHPPPLPRPAIEAVFTAFPRLETPRLVLRRIEQRDDEWRRGELKPTANPEWQER